MSEIKWTKNQESAINHNKGSMIVTAAAGSGKTAVIVARVLRIIQSTDIDRLIIVTFTKSAAQQMRDKLSEEIIKVINDENTDQKLRDRYTRQLLLLPNTNICTIHSFCMHLIKENFDKADVSPSFGICDESVRKVLFEKSLEELLEEAYTDENYLPVAKRYISARQDMTKEYITTLFHGAMKMPYPNEWLEMCHKAYDNFENSLWYKEYVEGSYDSLRETNEFYKTECLRYIEDNPFIEGGREMVSSDTDAVNAIFESEHSYQNLYSLLNKITFERQSPKINKTDTEGFLSEKRAKFKKNIKALCPPVSFDVLKEMIEIQSMDIKVFISYAKRLMEIFDEKKKKAELLDYNDLEHIAIKLLCDENKKPTSLAESLSLEYDEIIIDEYQDTNDVQEVIFNAISRDGKNLFTVGDMKQSIYSFRNTAPELFLHKVKSYADGMQGTREILSKNFRSRQNIIDYINAVFSQIMNERTGEISYDENEMLYKESAYDNQDPSVELHILKDDKEIDDVTLEALKIGEIIQRILKEQEITDLKTGEKRPTQLKDICIISRKIKGVTSRIGEVLLSLGIPVSLDDASEMFLSSYETQIITSYLKIIDNPYQDIPLASVMRSPIYRIDDNTLANISKARNKKLSFYEGVINYANENDDKKVKRFLADLSKYREKSHYKKCCEIIDDILTETGFLDFASNLKGGEQRRMNLEFLTRYAATFEENAKKGLYEFINYLENINTFSSELNSPKYMPDSIDAVKITSIHKSKGLEYPIVIVANLNSTFNFMSERNNMLCDKRLGVGFTYFNAPLGYKVASPVNKAIVQKMRMMQVSEEMRILYVALTRAKEKLVLVGTDTEDFKAVQKAKLSVGEKVLNLPERYMKSCTSLLDFILLGTVRIKEIPFGESKNKTVFANNLTQDIDIHIESKLPDIIEFEEKEETKEDKTEGVVSDEIIRRLTYKYPMDEKYHSKYAVSELKKLDEDESVVCYEKLASLDEQEESGAKKGTAIHKVFEILDAKEIIDEKSIEKALEGRFDIDEINNINLDEIAGFYTSSLGEMLKKSNEIYKELPFVIPEKEYLIQGVIDCVFKYEDKYIIVDYKSDNITDKNKDERIKAYQIQVSYYKEAVKKLFDTDKVEGYIYFTKTKEMINIDKIF